MLPVRKRPRHGAGVLSEQFHQYPGPDIDKVGRYQQEHEYVSGGGVAQPRPYRDIMAQDHGYPENITEKDPGDKRQVSVAPTSMGRDKGYAGSQDQKLEQQRDNSLRVLHIVIPYLLSTPGAALTLIEPGLHD